MSAVIFVVRDKITGEILREGTAPKNMASAQATEENEVADIVADASITGRTHYFGGSAYVQKQPMGIIADNLSLAADSAEVVTFSGVPVGTVVDGMMINDGVLEYSVDSLGKHDVVFSNKPAYLDETITITGVE